LFQLGAAYGIKAYRADTQVALKQALSLSRSDGPTLIEAVVAPHGAREKYRRLVRELSTRLRLILPNGT
jgi:thiamine pyrophosphate-dependent acetolactate synthase large subunit-like protein